MGAGGGPGREVADSPGSAPPMLVAVSLKMYFSHRQTLRWCEQVARLAREHQAIRSGAVALVVLPGFTALAQAVRLLSGTGVHVGAQDLFWDDRGPFTGEIGGKELDEIGCRFAEVGHAERRTIFHETDRVVALKLLAARRNGLIPLLCVGETEYASPRAAADSSIAQVEAALALWTAPDSMAATTRLADPPQLSLAVAYEPVWAIGARRPAPQAHIATVCDALRRWLADKRADLGESRVLYGGSAGQGLLGGLGGSADGLFLGRFAHDPRALSVILDDALAYSVAHRASGP